MCHENIARRDDLFAYFEYTVRHFASDMAKMAADPATQRWWAVCKPCQYPLASRVRDEWWAGMEEKFHLNS
jgi:L-rhamnose mutarotase